MINGCAMRPARTAVSVCVIAGSLAAGMLASGARAEELGTTVLGKRLVAVVDADPLELARIARHFTDGTLLTLLGPGTDTAMRLAAVRASPWLHAPERALAMLSEIASGRGNGACAWN